MTDERMALIELIEQGADADLIRDMLAFAAERLMNLEVEALTGAAAGTRSPDRLTHRNGYRERAWDTRAGRIDLASPSCARAPTSRLSSSRAAPPRRRSRPSSRRLTSTASPPAP
jgi:hypothetical protein